MKNLTTLLATSLLALSSVASAAAPEGFIGFWVQPYTLTAMVEFEDGTMIAEAVPMPDAETCMEEGELWEFQNYAIEESGEGRVRYVCFPQTDFKAEIQ